MKERKLQNEYLYSQDDEYIEWKKSFFGL
jgi:hypothetical protein